MELVGDATLGPLQHKDTSAPGQALEFRVWTELIQQSRGALHVFLPLLDRGLDGVIHRLTDGAYVPVQVKSRSDTIEGMVQIVVPGSRLVDDSALLIAGLLTDDGLSETLLVVDEGTFKRLATHALVQGQDIYEAGFSMHPRTSRWKPYLVARDKLGERVLGPSPLGFLPPIPEKYRLEPVDRHDQWLGFLGESEVIRRLAENPRLDLFRPFPDLEMVEVLGRDNASGRFAGLQVKTAVPAQWGEAHFRVHKSTFVASPTTYVAGLAWLPDRSAFAEQCLLVPADRLLDVATDGGVGWVLNFHPDSPERTPLDPFRLPLSDLGRRLTELIMQPSTPDSDASAG